MRKEICVVMLCVAVVATGCSGNSKNSGTTKSSSNKQATVTDYVSCEAVEADIVNAADAEDSKTDITGDFSYTTDNEEGISESNGVYTITAAGEYTFTGKLAEGQIVVDAGDDDDVTIILSNASISSTTDSPIKVINAASAKVRVEESTYNEVNDLREMKTDLSDATESTEDDTEDSDSEDESSIGSAAIYSKCDLSIVGKGALNITASYNNGIQSKHDLSIKNLTLKVTAANNGLKGADSVDIESGEVKVISTMGDGIKTVNSDVSSKDKQRGTVTIEGGNVDVYAAHDGIDAAYSVDVTGEGNLNIYTDTYSEYSGESTGSNESYSEMYLVISQDDYSNSNEYYAYFYNEDESTGKWMPATFYTMVSSGRTQYYGLLINAPSGYSNVAFYTITADTEPSLDNYVACTSGDVINSSMNGYLVSGISDKTMSGDWTSLESNSNGSSSKTAYSSKGIKAASTVNIEGGYINISSMDDGIHASADDLESGETGEGKITISGGTITISAADDGMHADNVLEINSGYINVKESYEGLEANQVNINGGKTFVYADDDAVNASAGSETPLVKVTDGYLDVTTPSGDTDAIDSNGSYEQTGGFVFVKGGSSQGSMAGSVDVDGSITVNGGAIVALGGICETPTNSDCNAYTLSGTSFTAGSYTLTDKSGDAIITFDVTGTYQSAWICSDKMEEGTDYTLSQDGTEIESWSQESGTMGATNSGFGGFGGGGKGGFGGRG